MATIELPKRSILDELAEQKDRIIEEGNLYLAYIYSSLKRQPKRIYRFEDLIEHLETLKVTVAKSQNLYLLRGINRESGKREDIVSTRRKDLVKYLRRVQKLFETYKALEREEDE